MLNNYLVSSEDWQLRSRYTDAMVVVWRTEYFDQTTGKNTMGAWMLEHLQSRQVSDGWTVVAGHCGAKNAVTVEVKCLAGEGEEDECFKDSSGNSYPLRPSDAYRGDQPVRLGRCCKRHLC
jgi:hypothetical protein